MTLFKAWQADFKAVALRCLDVTGHDLWWNQSGKRLERDGRLAVLLLRLGSWFDTTEFR